MSFQQFHAHVVFILALLASTGMGMRAWSKKDWTRVPEMIPRIYLAIMYLLVANSSNPTPSDWYAPLVRYGITMLLLTEVIFDFVMMGTALREKYENAKSN